MVKSAESSSDKKKMRANKMRIVFFGDSITDLGRNYQASDGTASSLGYGYVMFVARRLLSEDPSGYEIINRGVGGNRIVDLYARIRKDVWNLAPDVLSIYVGTNDNDFDGNDNGVDLERWEKVYRAIIEETRQRFSNIKIIVCLPFVIHGERSDEAYEKDREVLAYVERGKKIARDYGIPYVELQEKMTEAAKRYGDRIVAPDGIHPNVYGSNIIAEEWLKAFEILVSE